MDFCTKTNQVKLTPSESMAIGRALDVLNHVKRLSDVDDAVLANDATKSLKAMSLRLVHPAPPTPRKPKENTVPA